MPELPLMPFRVLLLQRLRRTPTIIPMLPGFSLYCCCFNFAISDCLLLQVQSTEPLKQGSVLLQVFLANWLLLKGYRMLQTGFHDG